MNGDFVEQLTKDDGFEIRQFEDVGPHGGAVAIGLVEHVVDSSCIWRPPGVGIAVIAVSVVIGTEPFAQFVIDFFDAVDHFIANDLIGLSWEMIEKILA